uniref:Uncharacterized protein n=1 Tax=Glossina austeni TaxID=7395 RepID=A0A1A9UP58_GLOAU
MSFCSSSLSRVVGRGRHKNCTKFFSIFRRIMRPWKVYILKPVSSLTFHDDTPSPTLSVQAKYSARKPPERYWEQSQQPHNTDRKHPDPLGNYKDHFES